MDRYVCTGMNIYIHGGQEAPLINRGFSAAFGQSLWLKKRFPLCVICPRIEKSSMKVKDVNDRIQLKTK